MNLSLNDKKLIFVSFSPDFSTASWSTYASMPSEAVLKSVKKFDKNLIFIIKG